MNDILLAIIAVLGSTSAWQYYESKRKEKKEADSWIRVDCTQRIEKLEALLEASRAENIGLREEILKLTASLNQLKVKVEYLEKETLIK
jgi:predicted RNase H-like nuclease (RuvC/YqgF family)